LPFGIPKEEKEKKKKKKKKNQVVLLIDCAACHPNAAYEYIIYGISEIVVNKMLWIC
jgi:hypothetical protein